MLSLHFNYPLSIDHDNLSLLFCPSTFQLLDICDRRIAEDVAAAEGGVDVSSSNSSSGGQGDGHAEYKGHGDDGQVFLDAGVAQPFSLRTKMVQLEEHVSVCADGPTYVHFTRPYPHFTRSLSRRFPPPFCPF